MRILSKVKDGGQESPVDAYFLVEWKSVFSIALLKFHKGRREQFHTHAFNALTWLVSGDLIEEDCDTGDFYQYDRFLMPKVTKRTTNHRVTAFKDSWCFTVRGPWSSEWREVDKDKNTVSTLTNGRKVTKVNQFNQD